MARNMSFAMTTDQIRCRQKTVTRRDGWLFAKVGDRVRPVNKCMGLKPGQSPEALLPDGELIEFVSVRREPLNQITQEDVIAEGFPNLTPAEFVALYRCHDRRPDDREITRIEFRYLESGDE